MKCDLCSAQEAVVHLTEIINGQSRELHLCEACAREKGAEQLALETPVLGPGGTAAASLAGLLAGLADLGVKMPSGQRTVPKLTCPQCGMTFSQFRKGGRLGCDHCYAAFSKYLGPLLQRIHGSAHYAGKLPPAETKKKTKLSPAQQLIRLKQDLQAAIADELFERAADLRDQIRVLERKKR